MGVGVVGIGVRLGVEARGEEALLLDAVFRLPAVCVALLWLVVRERDSSQVTQGVHRLEQKGPDLVDLHQAEARELEILVVDHRKALPGLQQPYLPQVLDDGSQLVRRVHKIVRTHVQQDLGDGDPVPRQTAHPFLHPLLLAVLALQVHHAQPVRNDNVALLLFLQQHRQPERHLRLLQGSQPLHVSSNQLHSVHRVPWQDVDGLLLRKKRHFPHAHASFFHFALHCCPGPLASGFTEILRTYTVEKNLPFSIC